MKSLRDAAYTTQPLELLNALDFDNLEISGFLIRGFRIENERGDNHHLDASENGQAPALATLGSGDNITVRKHYASVSVEPSSEYYYLIMMFYV